MALPHAKVSPWLVTVEVSPADYVRMQARAKRDRVSVAALVERALVELLDDRPRRNPEEDPKWEAERVEAEAAAQKKFDALERKIQREIAKVAADDADAVAVLRAINRLDDMTSKSPLVFRPANAARTDRVRALRVARNEAVEVARGVVSTKRAAEMKRLREEMRAPTEIERMYADPHGYRRQKNPSSQRDWLKKAKAELVRADRAWRDGDRAERYIATYAAARAFEKAGPRYAEKAADLRKRGAEQKEESERLGNDPSVDAAAMRSPGEILRRKNDYQGGGLTAAQAKKQKRALEREIKVSHQKAALEKLASLRWQIAAARRSGKPKRADAVELCKIGRSMAKDQAKRLRVEGRAAIRAAIVEEKKAAREACDARKAKVKEDVKSDVARARAELKEERAYQREIRNIEANVRKRERPRSSAKERRQESDDAVRQNIPAELLPLFEKVKRHIKGSDRESRTEAFLHYAEENPGELDALIEASAEREIARLEREEAKEAKRLRGRGFSAADLEAVPF